MDNVSGAIAWSVLVDLMDADFEGNVCTMIDGGMSPERIARHVFADEEIPRETADLYYQAIAWYAEQLRQERASIAALN